LRFLPEIEQDLMEAYDWYEEKVHGLGEELIRTFYSLSGELDQVAYHYQVVYDGFRRRLLHKFPYAIYFRIEENQVIVFGLFHCARDPLSIRDMLTIRDMK
jgi:plasmid stabilization system protein ParE